MLPAAPPIGTVTFLFTGLEGSTWLLRSLRERYSEVLLRHNEIIRCAVEASAGREVDTAGDGFFVVFARARDGVSAAVAAQRALAAEPWPEGHEPRVRMGLHTGEAMLVGERYMGLAVQRAARIAGAARGGEILVSQKKVELLHDDEDVLEVELDEIASTR
jgi:class 3 adenylate cyclase